MRNMHTTAGVLLKMNSSLREDSHHSRVKLVDHKTGAILGEQSRSQGTVDAEVDFRSTRMGMRGVHGARSQKAHGYIFREFGLLRKKLEYNLLMATPLSTTAAKVPEVAVTVWPPAPVTTPAGGLKKSKTNCEEVD